MLIKFNYNYGSKMRRSPKTPRTKVLGVYLLPFRSSLKKIRPLWNYWVVEGLFWVTIVQRYGFANRKEKVRAPGSIPGLRTFLLFISDYINAGVKFNSVFARPVASHGLRLCRPRQRRLF